MEVQSVCQGPKVLPGGDADHGSSDPGPTERNSVGPSRTQDVFAVDEDLFSSTWLPVRAPGANVRPLTLAP